MSTSTKASPVKSLKIAPDSTAAVDVFMATLEHPCKSMIEALRTIILAADPRIAEGIKWKSPSFRIEQYFATTHLRCKTGIGLILHFGAKVRELPVGGAQIDDPAALLTWLAADRAMIGFADANALQANEAALQSIIRQWIKVEGLSV